MVFLSLTRHEAEVFTEAQVDFVTPRGAKNAHVFKVPIHIDVVEDLMFYHYLCEELLADGKVPRWDFVWKYGVSDGDLPNDDISPLTHVCSPDMDQRWHPRDDEDDD
jgi:hypothetical protein